MVSMNILLINHYAGSLRHGMEYRPYYLAREWLRAGHTVRIVAASHTHLRAVPSGCDGRPRHDELIDGIAYSWLATPPYHGNGLGRARNMAAFVAGLYRQARTLVRECRPDLVIASSTYPADIWPARHIARLSGARLAFEVHDLWPLSPMALGGLPRWHPFIVLMQAAENHACRHADTVISLLPKAGAHLQAHGMAPHKLHIIPNGIDPAEWQHAPEPLAAALAGQLAALRARGPLVGYAGSHGSANALGNLLQAARLLEHEAVFVLAGDGPLKPSLQRQAERDGLRNVHFLPPQPKRAMPALLAAFDLAYLGWQSHPLYRHGIAPNKLGDYMMAARPVLHAVDAGNDPVAEAGCGISVAPERPDLLAGAIRRLLALPPAQRAELGRRGRRHALQHLTYALLAERMLAACCGAAPSTGVHHEHPPH